MSLTLSPFLPREHEDPYAQQWFGLRDLRKDPPVPLSRPSPTPLPLRFLGQDRVNQCCDLHSSTPAPAPPFFNVRGPAGPEHWSVVCRRLSLCAHSHCQTTVSPRSDRHRGVCNPVKAKPGHAGHFAICSCSCSERSDDDAKLHGALPHA